MKVLGYTDEIIACDCCGKSNLRGTFGVETDAGDVLHYGSVCVNRVYGKTRGNGIKFIAEQMRKAQAGTWDAAIDRLSRGMLQPFIGIKADGKMAWSNSRAEMAAIVAIKDAKSGQIVRSRAA